MKLTFVRQSDFDTHPYPFPQFELQVHGTAEIMQFTEDLREYIDGVEITSSILKHRTDRCFDIASNFNINRRVLFSLDNPREGSECAIFIADLEAMNWLEALDEDLSRIAIADSFDEFLERSISHMLEFESGFKYWQEVQPDSGFW